MTRFAEVRLLRRNQSGRRWNSSDYRYGNCRQEPDPVQAAPDGLSVVPYNGAPLTVGGELNKLASNIAIGRNIAGVHWRSDASESLKLGEEVAIRYLRDERHCFNEEFAGFSVTKLDGTTITI